MESYLAALLAVFKARSPCTFQVFLLYSGHGCNVAKFIDNTERENEVK